MVAKFSWQKWFVTKWSPRSGSVGRRSRRATHRSANPAMVEMLEPRTLLSAITVNSAADNTISGDGLTTLREAIIEANTNAGADTITFGDGTSSGGTNFLDSTPDTITLGGTELALTDTIGKLTITGPGANLLTINGGGASGIFYNAAGSDAEINGLTITNGIRNQMLVGGGGVANLGTLALNSVAVTNCLSGYNFGAGIYTAGPLTMSNSTIAFNGNNFSDGGGLFVNSGASADLTNCTFSDNIGLFGSGIYVNPAASVTLANCTISGSGQHGELYLNATTTASLNNTVVVGSGNESISGVGVSTYTGSNNFIGGNALLAPLGNYGGPTQTMPPLSGSPLLNAGSNGAVPIGVTTDQRGLSRFVGTVDIGAVEADEAPSFVVNTNQDVVNPRDNLTSLREAINYANNHSGPDTISFAAALNGQTILLTSGQINVTSALTITGNGTANTIVDGNNASRIFNVNDSTGAQQVVAITGLTLQHGNADSGDGGAIFNDENLTLSNSLIANNQASMSFITVGGGVFNSGTLTATGNTFSGNSGYGGGALGNVGGFVTLTGNTFTGNSALNGGGIYNNNGSTLVSRNDTIVGNSTPLGGGGGGIRNQGEFTTINGTIAFNSGTFGGGVLQDAGGSGPWNLFNTIIAGNTTDGVNDPDVYLFTGTVNASHSLIGDTSLTGTPGITNVPGGAFTIFGANTLANNGGPTQTIAIQPNFSPALNAGSDLLIPGDVTTDQRGQPRIVGLSVDIGAYESQASDATNILAQIIPVTSPVSPLVSLLDDINTAVTGGTLETITTAANNFISAATNELTSATSGVDLNTYIALSTQVVALTNTFGITTPVSLEDQVTYITSFVTLANTIPGGLTGGNPLVGPWVQSAIALITQADNTEDTIHAFTSTAVGLTNLPVDTENPAESGVDLNTFITLATHVVNLTNAIGATQPVPLEMQVIFITSFLGMAENIPGGLTGGNPLVASWNQAAITLITQVGDPEATINGFTSTAVGLTNLPVDTENPAESGVDLPTFITLATHVVNLTNAIGATIPVPLDVQVIFIESFVGMAENIPGGLTGGNPLVSSWNQAAIALITQVDDPEDTIHAFTSTAVGLTNLPVDTENPAESGVDLPTFITLATHVVNLTNAIGATIPVPLEVQVIFIESFVGMANNIPGGLTGGNPLVASWNQAAITLITQVGDPEDPIHAFTSTAVDLTNLPVDTEDPAGSGVDLPTFITLATHVVNLTNAIGATAPVPVETQAAFIQSFVGMAGNIPGGLTGGNPLVPSWNQAAVALIEQNIPDTMSALNSFINTAVSDPSTALNLSTLNTLETLVTTLETAIGSMFPVPFTAPAVTLTPSVASPSYGQTLSYTAQVTSPAPGTVSFFVDGSASGSPVPVASGQAVSANISDLSVGTHIVSAVFTSTAGLTLTGANSTSLTVGQAATTLSLSSSSAVSVPGQYVTLTANVSALTGGTPTGSVTFRDGSTILATVPLTGGVASTSVAFATLGSHNLTATYTPTSNFAAAGPVSVNQSVQATTLLPGPAAGQWVLYVGGTNGDDNIDIHVKNSNCGPDESRVRIKTKGVSGEFNTGWVSAPSGSIVKVVAYGLDGNDEIKVDDQKPGVSAWLFGGKGNDELKAGKGSAMLVGGDGNDELEGGNGLGVLIGGSGSDELEAGKGNTVLIAGSTTYDTPTPANLVALENVMSSLAAGGSTLSTLLNATTIDDDGNAADELDGGNGSDWFFANVLKDEIEKKKSSDRLTNIAGW